MHALLPAASSGAVRAAGVVTFASGDGPHFYRRGEKITITGVADASFNGPAYVATVPSPSTFTAVQAGPDATSGGGTMVNQALGGCVTGGAFYDSTGFPPQYHGHFFFGDFNSGKLVRATIDPASNVVNAVDSWGSGFPAPVDSAVGPDGALYVVGHGGNVQRIVYNGFAQGLVVTPTNVWTAEGQAAAVSVRLAIQPPTDQVVSVARSTGDSDVTVLAPAELTFTRANWDLPQTVTIAAGRDLDTTDDLATISFTGDGVAAQSTTVHVRDENNLTLMVSPSALALDEGQSGTVTVTLSAQPSLDVVVSATRTDGDGDVTVSAGSTVTFSRANWSTPQMVTISAAQDPDGTDDADASPDVPAPPPADAASDTAATADAGAPDAGAADAGQADASADTAAAPDVPPGGDGPASLGDAGASKATSAGGGCGCRLAGRPSGGTVVSLFLVAALAARRRRR